MGDNLTLIMSRMPLEEVKHGRKSGRWGKMAVVKGGKVLHGRYTGTVKPEYTLPDALTGGGLGGMLGKLAVGYMEFLEAGKTEISVGGRGVLLTTFGPIEVVKQYETLERFKTDSGKGYYVILKPRPHSTYLLIPSHANAVEKTVNPSGRCLRVKNHDTKNEDGIVAGILMHEACHPGFLIGCIAPYPANNRHLHPYDHSTSRGAMEEIYSMVVSYGTADLLVLDY